MSSKEPISVSDWSQKYKLAFATLALIILIGGFLYLGNKIQQKQTFGDSISSISPNLNVGVNTSSTVTSTAFQAVPMRSQNMIQWCFNGAAQIWIGVTTTNLIAGSVSGSGYYVATSTAFPDSFKDYPGAIFAVTPTGATSTVQCARF